MLLADTKYKTLVEKGIWEAPSAEEEKIIALQAKYESLKRQVQVDKSSDGTAGKGSKKKGLKKKTPPKPDWMFKEPSKEKLTEPRMWNGKPWHWCSPKTGGKCKGAN